jgi:RNA polymerase sigma-70 factor (ECF subfamily)
MGVPVRGFEGPLGETLLMLSFSRFPTDRSEQTAEFVSLYAAHSRRIYGFLRTLIANSADVDEAFQNTCEVLWSKFDQYEPGTSFFSWACTVARFEALRLLRQRGRDSRIFSSEFYDAVADRAMEMSEFLEQQHTALADCFAALPPRHQTLVQLRYAAGGSVQRVSEQMAMTTGAVYKQLGRIHERLFGCIQQKLAGGGQSQKR